MSGNEEEERREFDGCARWRKRSIDPLRPRASKHAHFNILPWARRIKQPVSSLCQIHYGIDGFLWRFVYLRSVVSPRAEFHVARLLVEREVLDVDLAEGFVNGRRFPLDGAVVAQDGFGHDGHFVITIGTARASKVIIIITANCWRQDPAIDGRHLLTIRWLPWQIKEATNWPIVSVSCHFSGLMPKHQPTKPVRPSSQSDVRDDLRISPCPAIYGPPEVKICKDCHMFPPFNYVNDLTMALNCSIVDSNGFLAPWWPFDR